MTTEPRPPLPPQLLLFFHSLVSSSAYKSCNNKQCEKTKKSTWKINENCFCNNYAAILSQTARPLASPPVTPPHYSSLHYKPTPPPPHHIIALYAFPIFHQTNKMKRNSQKKIKNNRKNRENNKLNKYFLISCQTALQLRLQLILASTHPAPFAHSLSLPQPINEIRSSSFCRVDFALAIAGFCWFFRLPLRVYTASFHPSSCPPPPQTSGYLCTFWELLLLLIFPARFSLLLLLLFHLIGKISNWCAEMQ